MDYETVYEVTQESMKLTWLGSGAALLGLSGYLIYQIVKRPEKWIKSVLGIGICWLFTLLWATLVFSHQVGGYYEMKEAISKGKFEVVEGTVAKFDPMPYSGHKHEAFVVNSIKFEYSDFDEEFYGMNQTKSHGGPVTGNGQRVKIEYYNRADVNYIWKMEIKKYD